jgi:hypothetical protein
MLNKLTDKTIQGIVDYIDKFVELFNDHNHNKINSKGVSRESDYVGLSGNETIAGVKTFSSLIKIPTSTPSDNAHAISKQHLEANYTEDSDVSLVGKSWFLDEDNFASNNASKVASQQSIKAYVDNNYTGDTETDLSSKSWFLDEDTFSSDSATKVASQQSIKAYIDDLGVHDTSKVISLTASDNLRAGSDSESQESDVSAPTYTKVKEIKIRRMGSIRIKFDMRTPEGNAVEGKIYFNGVSRGTERSSNSTSYITYSEDETIDLDDLSDGGGGCYVQLYVKSSAASTYVYTRNFRIYYDRDYSVDYEVIT